MTHPRSASLLLLPLLACACAPEAPVDNESKAAAMGDHATGDAPPEQHDADAHEQAPDNVGDAGANDEGPWTVAELCAARPTPSSGGLTPPRAEPGCVDKRCGATCDPCAMRQAPCNVATDQQYACNVWGGCFPVLRDPADPIPGDIVQVELTRANEGQTITLALTNKARLKLQTIGPGQFEKPTLTGSGVTFEDAALQTPANPGGPTQIYVFACVQPGTVMVSIPHSGSSQPFRINFTCG